MRERRKKDAAEAMAMEDEILGGATLPGSSTSTACEFLKDSLLGGKLNLFSDAELELTNLRPLVAQLTSWNYGIHIDYLSFWQYAWRLLC